MAEPEFTVSTQTLPGSQVSLTVEVTQATVDATFEQVLNRLVQKAKIEGFRPGRAPRALVEARLGPAAVREEVIDSLIPHVIGHALEDIGIDPIDRPRVEDLDLERGRPARFTARVSVMPEVTIPDLDSIEADRPRADITDDMVERRLAELREQLAEITPVEREVRRGDVVVADLEVERDGRPVPEEARTAMEVEVAEGVLIPELLAVLPGKRVDEVAVAEVNTGGPEPGGADLPESTAAGSPATLRLTVRGVKEKRLPELDDEVAKRLSNDEHETAQALREAVRADLRASAARMSDLAYEQAVLRAVVEGSQVDVPQALVDREVERQLEELERRLQQQGLRLDRYLAYLQQTPEQYIALARPEAEARLKVDLVLEEIGRREKIEPGDDEVVAYMHEESAKDDELKDRVSELAASRAARDYFRHRLTRLRILESLVARAKPLGNGAPAAAGGRAGRAPGRASGARGPGTKRVANATDSAK